MLTPPVHPLQLAGVVFTMALLALAWASRGRLNSMGFEFLHWNRTTRSAVLPSHCYSRPYTKARRSNGRMPGSELPSVLSLEEAVFRGYLFGLAEWGLRKRVPQAAWTVGIAIAAVFALCHLPKDGITGLQIGVIFVMGVVYTWLRIKSNSTTLPFLAHSAYNAIIFAAAALLA